MYTMLFFHRLLETEGWDFAIGWAYQVFADEKQGVLQEQSLYLPTAYQNKDDAYAFASFCPNRGAELTHVWRLHNQILTNE